MRVPLLDVTIDQITFDHALDQIESFIHHGGPHQIVTVNPEFVMRARTDLTFRKIINRADLAVPDGAGLLFTSRILHLWQRLRGSQKNFRLAERVTGADLIFSLAQRAEHEGWKLYFLGGDPGNADRAAATLKTRFPNLRIVGTEIGPILTSRAEPINADQKVYLTTVLNRINHSQPAILFVAFGAPKQDIFIHRYRDQLKVPVMMGVGGAFEFYAGTARRAPSWIQFLWLEWVWRLVVEPWRTKRILTAAFGYPLTFLFSKKTWTTD